MFLLKTPLPFLIVLSAILLMGCTGSPVADEQPTGPITDSLNNLSKNKFNPSRTIYLTFDDGPMVGTETVITILEAQQVPATFFMVGKHAQFMPNAKSCLGRIKSNTAFEIANHSYSHGYNNHYDRYYNMPQAVVEDFEKAKPYLDPVLPLYRTPGNNFWRTHTITSNGGPKRYVPAINVLAGSNNQVLGWDVEWFHYKFRLKQTPDTLLSQINRAFLNNTNKTTGHCVLLMHDACFKDPNDSLQLLRFIAQAKDSGYLFAKASAHPSLVQP